MFCSSDKFTFMYLWLFAALFTVGWSQDVLKTSQTKRLNVSTSQSSFLVENAIPIPTIMPVYIRHQRASSRGLTSSCSAPPQPLNGKYKVDRYFCEDNSADCNISEGTSMEPGSQLVYSCNTGFRAKGNPDVYCSRGKWSTIPSCIEVKCASLNSASTSVSCTRLGKWVNCDSLVLPETRAEVTCRRGYKKDTDFISARRGVVNCNINGKWEPDPIRCVPVCGLAIANQQPLVHGGVLAKIGDFPWHASLFVQKNFQSGSKKVFLCGATIIQTNLVLTAAHCVYDERSQATEDPAKLFLITGNIFRDYDSKHHNPDIVRKATVKNVYTYCNYYGLTGNYVSDIALLELQQPFEFSSILLPACLDDSGYGEQFLEPGIYGRVAGFGKTTSGVSSGILQTITVPYISYNQCKISENTAQTRAFISSDKFCAGHNNGSAVCEGDSGGGLVFRKGNLWHVMGIVSVGLGFDIHSGETTCDKYSYTLYTKVSTYMTWIQDVLFYVERNEQYPSCSRDSSPSMVTSTTPIPVVTLQSVTKPSIAPAVTNWWDKLTSPTPDVTTPNPVMSFCFAPPQPPNGERKLHKDFCKGDMDCNISEGTALSPGTQLVYNCHPGFGGEGTTNVYCHASGTWSSIPNCTAFYESGCECVAYYRCTDGVAIQTDGLAHLDIRHVLFKLYPSKLENLEAQSTSGIVDDVNITEINHFSPKSWRVAFLTVGWAQDVSYNSLTEDVHVLPSGWPFLMKPGSYIRRRRASASVCLTPPQPANGQYEFDKNSCDNTADCQFSEGTALEPGSQLIYRCNAGYRAKGNTEVYCRSRGKWSTIPECVEVKCNSLNSVSTMVSCTRFGQWVNCDSAVLPETRAEVACRRGYKKDTDFITTRRPVVTCNGNGKWVPEPIRCVPVCGLVITHQQPLILGGTVAKIGDFPWHASLFVQVNNEKIFICGATIIQNSLLLTAAHCVYDEGTKTTTQPEKLFVITGNIFRDYDSSAHNPEIVRKAKVKHVYTFCHYYGLTGNYASDIALLILQQPFEYSSILLPACLDDSEYSEQFLEPGAYGRVAGFGRTETSTASGVLQTITVPYVSYSQCRESKHGEQNQAFISSDKFCAGHTNGSAVCEGDSGGGLVFKKGELWYVLGIVSVGLGVDIDRGERTCDRYSYTLYTKVTNYMTWIQDVLSSLESDQPYSSCRPGFSNPHIGGSNTPPQTKVSNCLAPPQPINGKRKLHRNFCNGDVECSVSEGTELKLGSQLIYSCDSQFTIDGSTDVHCTSGGKWTAIPTCVGAPCSSPNGGSGGCTTPRPLSTENTAGLEIGVIARQKCMEYAKYVNTQRCPPFADLGGQPAKVAPTTGKTKAGSMEFPHMAAIGFVRDDGMIGWYCGGTLISETFVLTTVTCTITKVVGNATWVRVGDLNLVQSVYGATPEDRRVAERILHPDYKHPVEYHNVALLRLESRVPFNGWIRPACLHTSPTTGTREAIATGWGRPEWLDDKSSDDLLKVTLPFVDLETCNTQWTSGITDGRVPNGIVGDWLMCAGSVGKDTCKGDSGGPLVIHSADKEKERCMYVVVGITSLGRACGTGFPGLYIRVYHYVSWIESVVWGQG